MNIPMTVNVHGLLQYCRATNARHVLAGAFPDMPDHIIDGLMSETFDLSTNDDGTVAVIAWEMPCSSGD